jgi:Flp pilus assembly protein TadD
MSARGSSAAIEDTMFFPRLRRHAKWMFVFLALVFGVGFVAFGVGAGGTGLGDIFRGTGGGSGVSVGDARKATEENPQDAEAWRDLSTALQTEGETEEAITALDQYLRLRPEDASALRELGGLYLTQGAIQRQRAQEVQLRAQLAGAGSIFDPSLVAGGVDRFENPIARALEARFNDELTRELGASGTAYSRAVATYRRLAAATPNDASVQLELAQAAEQAGDAQAAIEAYERFLELAPQDPNAAIVQQQLERLRASSG